MSVKAVKSKENAQDFKYAYETPAGADIAIIDIIKVTDGIIYCGTGWKLDIAKDHYVQLVPRSSLPKSNFTLANSIGIIDSDYKGEIIVALQPTSVYAVQVMYEFMATYKDKLEDMVPSNGSKWLSESITDIFVEKIKSMLPFYPCQLIKSSMSHEKIECIDIISTSIRGDNGFGSSK